MLSKRPLEWVKLSVGGSYCWVRTHKGQSLKNFDNAKELKRWRFGGGKGRRSCEEMKYFKMGILVILQGQGIIQLYDTWKHQKEFSRVKSITVRQLITAIA